MKSWMGKSIKKTRVPGTLLTYITAKGLAYWILDDGSLNKNKGYLTLHTEGFRKKEV